MPHAVLHDTALALAKQLATQATRGFGLTKRAMNASFSNSLDEQLDVEAECMHEAGKTADYEEGVRAFLRTENLCTRAPELPWLNLQLRWVRRR